MLIVFPRLMGQQTTFESHGRTFSVKRLGRVTWHLRDHAVTERSRFGDREQIARDLEHVKQHGVLPPPTDRHW